jgi:hypothetical protein
MKKEQEENNYMYNQNLIGTLAGTFTVLATNMEKFTQPDPNLDLYSYIASTLYNVPYEECCEQRPDGTWNHEGKECRNKVKQLLIPIVLECGGIHEPGTVEDDV